jgi:hypothetical protein
METNNRTGEPVEKNKRPISELPEHIVLKPEDLLRSGDLFVSSFDGCFWPKV